MQRFENHPLGPQPRIVVLGASKLGNYVVLQPLLRGLREKYPGCTLTYVGSAAPLSWSSATPGCSTISPSPSRERRPWKLSATTPPPPGLIW